ncbi:hypothetical protein HYPSUDRAFT_599174, partial [Hypholoma sublateritium FD-334 SS-4]
RRLAPRIPAANHHVLLPPSPAARRCHHRGAVAPPVQAHAGEQHDALLPHPRGGTATGACGGTRALSGDTGRRRGRDGVQLRGHARALGADHALGGPWRRRARRAVARATADPALDVPRRHDRALSAQVRPPPARPRRAAGELRAINRMTLIFAAYFCAQRGRVQHAHALRVPEVVPRAQQGRRHDGGGDFARGVPAEHGPVGERRVGADARRAGAIHAGQPLPGAALPPERRGPQPLREVAVLVHHQRCVSDRGRLYAGDRAGGSACVCCTRSGGVNRPDSRSSAGCVYDKPVNMESTMTLLKTLRGHSSKSFLSAFAENRAKFNYCNVSYHREALGGAPAFL